MERRAFLKTVAGTSLVSSLGAWRVAAAELSAGPTDAFTGPRFAAVARACDSETVNRNPGSVSGSRPAGGRLDAAPPAD